MLILLPFLINFQLKGNKAVIICVTAELEMPYNKHLLADYLAGAKVESQVFTATVQQLVTAVDQQQKRIALLDGQLIAYDTLFLGLVSKAVIPPISGAGHLKGIFTFHTLVDVNNIRAWIVSSLLRTAVVIGAGLSGLEAANDY